MATIQQICDFLADYAPPVLAAEWDNVGLLVGDPARPARRIMTCLTVTPTTADEAVEEQADLIIAHHPLPFRPLKQVTSHTVPGQLLLQLIQAGVAVHSSHTAFDSAAGGINMRLAEGLGLTDIRPLVPSKDLAEAGSGRYGILPEPLALADLAARAKDFLTVEVLQIVGSPDERVRKVAVACGSAGEFLAAARSMGCDLLVTGETNFHTCLEAEATGVALLLPGHFASERFGMESLAAVLAQQFPDATVWASHHEADPLRWI